ncbi:hypothetical protein M9H77_26688 [Catharanthus roseus]|uniref:Uncharacterized protein n=1 Tax=Catharanthus roseus TaxID=4058 RepID=A0ACC0AAN1_CATRO|nr:hypothetical protein M9H77_26688 [Catharanthus roseus]
MLTESIGICFMKCKLTKECYPFSVAETRPLVSQEPNEVFHGWFLSVRASEAISHQSFAIPRSLKAVNVTLKASSTPGVKTSEIVLVLYLPHWPVLVHREPDMFLNNQKVPTLINL